MVGLSSSTTLRPRDSCEACKHGDIVPDHWHKAPVAQDNTRRDVMNAETRRAKVLRKHKMSWMPSPRLLAPMGPAFMYVHRVRVCSYYAADLCDALPDAPAEQEPSNGARHVSLGKHHQV